MSTPGPRTPPGRRWSATSRRSRAARFGFAFGSGLAALDTVLKLLKAGDHVVAGDNLYGGSQRLMTRVYADLGLRFTFADMRDVNAIEHAITPARG